MIYIDEENDYNLDLSLDIKNENISGFNINSSNYKEEDVDLKNTINNLNFLNSNEFINNFENKIDNIIKEDKTDIEEE